MDAYATSGYVEACSNLYYANDTRYQKLSYPNTPAESDRAAYIKRCEEAQSKVTAALARIRLLFKNGDSDFARIEPLLDAMRKSVDEPVKIDASFHMAPGPWNVALDAFLKGSNTLLAAEWEKIAK